MGLFRRHQVRAWDENGDEYVPDAPLDWARVVDIGSAPAAR